MIHADSSFHLASLTHLFLLKAILKNLAVLINPAAYRVRKYLRVRALFSVHFPPAGLGFALSFVLSIYYSRVIVVDLTRLKCASWFEKTVTFSLYIALSCRCSGC